jgi:hypothetical protein
VPSWGPQGWVRVAALSGVVALASSLFVVGSSPASAARGQISPQATKSTFAVRADGSVHVDVDATIANHDSCPTNYVCFFDAAVIPVPAAAFGFASDAGSVHTESATSFFSQAVVALPTHLVTGHSRVVHLTYDLGGAARSNPFVRTNPAYVEFFAFGSGDAGRVDVTVTVPDEFDSSVDFATMERSDDGHTTTYRATGISAPEDFTAAVSGRNDAALVHRAFTVSGHSVDLRSWPGDSGWATFVADELTRGVPTLERLVHARLPKAKTLTITETAAPYLYGYAGWYKVTDNSIEIGDDLNAEVILHEVSHEWFNRELFTDRWVDEGFAQAFSTLAVARLGGKLTQPDAVDPNAKGHLALDDWNAPQFRSDTADAEEKFGYNASFYVIRKISDEIGASGMAKVVAAAMRGDITYAAAGRTPEHQSGGYGWREFLDLLDNVGHSRTADALFRKYVVDAAESSQFAARLTARASYSRLVARSGAWSPPRSVRQALHDWNFGRAADETKVAVQTLAQRDATQRLLQPMRVDLPTSLRESFETGRTLVAAASSASDVRAAAESLSKARGALDAGRSVWQRIGLLGAHPDGALQRGERALSRGDLAATARATAEVTTTLGGARRAGEQRAATAGAVLLALLLLVWGGRRLVRRRRKRRLAPEAVEPVDAPGDTAGHAHADTAGDAPADEPADGDGSDGYESVQTG